MSLDDLQSLLYIANKSGRQVSTLLKIFKGAIYLEIYCENSFQIVVLFS